jgi:hypothetical protein
MQNPNFKIAMRYLVFLCNNLIGERFASASLLKSPNGSISGLLFLLTHNLCFLTLKKSIGNLFDGHGWGTWRQLGTIHEKYPTKKLPMVPPTMALPSSQHFVKHLQVPKNKSKHMTTHNFLLWVNIMSRALASSKKQM